MQYYLLACIHDRPIGCTHEYDCQDSVAASEWHDWQHSGSNAVVISKLKQCWPQLTYHRHGKKLWNSEPGLEVYLQLGQYSIKHMQHWSDETQSHNKKYERTPGIKHARCDGLRMARMVLRSRGFVWIRVDLRGSVDSGFVDSGIVDSWSRVDS